MTISPEEVQIAIKTIKEAIFAIDKRFAEASGWGSWMSSASERRRELVRRAAKLGVTIPDDNVFKTASGKISD